MNKTTPIKHYASRLTPYASRLNLDLLLGLLLFVAGLYAYTITLAPTVLEGDKALFQYTPYVLGVTYPTGFPLYILLGKLWLTIFPFGEIAWRMNFLSALCSAAALPLLYNAIRRLLSLPSNYPQENLVTSPPLGGIEGGSRWAALVAVLTFATLPTFWHWSTVAKTYPLNTLLLAGVLYLFSVAIEKHPSSPRKTTPLPVTPTLHPSDGVYPDEGRAQDKPSSFIPHPSSPIPHPSSFIFLLLGLQISVHNTAVLLIPGLLLFAWLNFRQYLLNKKLGLVHALLLILPGLFYLYIPLRAQGLIAQYGRDEAIQRGLLADFYQPGLAGLVDYFLAAKFTGGIVTNWGLIPERFVSVYIPLLTNNFHLLGIALGVIGGLALAILRPRIFWPLFLIYVVPIPFVLTYDRGEQSAFLIPSFLIFSIFVGSTLTLVQNLLPLPATHHAIRTTQYAPHNTHYASRFTSHVLRLILHPSSFILLLIFLFLPQIQYNYNWLENKWDRTIYNERADALSHPLEPGATMLAQWGDLTPIWYMQHVENRRPDLRGLYPPDEKVVADWFARGGKNLYIAGPLQDWASGIQKRYQLIPWGRLVRIAPYDLDPEALLPALPHILEVTFKPQNTDNHRLRLIGVDYPSQATAGSEYAVTLAWQALTDLPPETTISPRLSQGEAIVAQLDDSLLSSWFPRETLPADQYVLSYVPIPIPLGTLPGKYRLQLVVYTQHIQPWTISNGSTLLDLGEVEIISPPANYRPPSTTATLPNHDFNGEIELIDYDYSVRRVGQGKGFAVELLWRALKQPVDNYTLLAELVDTRGNVLRAVEHQPVGGRAPTATWQAGQFIRDQVDLVVPASAPAGSNTLRVRLSWLRPNGSKLNVRRWLLPMGDTLDLEGLNVTEKKGRVFEAPQTQYAIEANLENKARLIGYNVSSPSPAPLTPRYEGQISQKDCAADPAACHLHFDFYWQDLSEMEQSYSVFLHLVDEQGQIVIQHDQEPGERGKQPTTGWLPGEVITHPVDLYLPPDIAPGQYTLYLGMYLPPDGPRLLVLDEGGQAVADFVEVGTVRVTP